MHWPSRTAVAWWNLGFEGRRALVGSDPAGNRMGDDPTTSVARKAQVPHSTDPPPSTDAVQPFANGLETGAGSSSFMNVL
jgi:hypothetical protein